MIVFAKLIKILKVDCLSEFAEKFEKSLCWNGILGYLYEMYLVLTICGLMNMYYIRFDSVANILSLSLAIIFISVSVFLPIFYGYFYFKHYEKFKNENKEYLEKYGCLV